MPPGRWAASAAARPGRRSSTHGASRRIRARAPSSTLRWPEEATARPGTVPASDERATLIRDPELREQAIAHVLGGARARLGILPDGNAAAGDLVVTARHLAPQDALQDLAGVGLALGGPDGAEQAALERADGGGPVDPVEPEQEVGHLRHHVRVLHLVEDRDDDAVAVEDCLVDRLAEDAEVLARHARVLDLGEPSLVRVRIEEVRRLDVGRGGFAAEVLRRGGDPVEERGGDR